MKEIDELAFKFFKLFAQFEYALKQIGYAKFERGYIQLEWDLYAEEKGHFVWRQKESDSEIAEAIDYLLSSPPKKQIFNQEKQLAWQEVKCEKTVKEVFAGLRRIRNNLFHGGKFGGRWLAPDRSKKLIKHALTILEAQKEADINILEAIENSAE